MFHHIIIQPDRTFESRTGPLESPGGGGVTITAEAQDEAGGYLASALTSVEEALGALNHPNACGCDGCRDLNVAIDEIQTALSTISTINHLDIDDEDEEEEA